MSGIKSIQENKTPCTFLFSFVILTLRHIFLTAFELKTVHCEIVWMTPDATAKNCNATAFAMSDQTNLNTDKSTSWIQALTAKSVLTQPQTCACKCDSTIYIESICGHVCLCVGSYLAELVVRRKSSKFQTTRHTHIHTYICTYTRRTLTIMLYCRCS